MAESNESAPVEERGGGQRTFLYLLGFIGFYFALQLWILPAAGIPT